MARLFPSPFLLMTAALFAAIPAFRLAAQDEYYGGGGRKTLLQWSGSSEEGGPPGFDEP